MKEKQLRKLKRIELYEIMLAQADEIDRLKTELAQAEAELADKRIKIAEAGSLAQASLQLTKVFQEAQKTADLYLTNIKANVGEVDEG